MKSWLRAIKRRYGVTATRVAVRAHRPWYSLASELGLLLALGYALAWWQFSGGRVSSSVLSATPGHTEDAQTLQNRVVHVESQLQVANAAQSNLAGELAGLQAENMRLKEEVAFYESVLTENGSAGVPKIHRVKFVKGGRSGELEYQILLVQSGKHDKPVQGMLQMTLNGVRDGKSVAERLEPSGQKELKINFKYYQRLEGVVAVPGNANPQTIEVRYVPAGKAQPLLQTANVPR